MNFDSCDQSEVDHVNSWRGWCHRDLLELYVACHGDLTWDLQGYVNIPVNKTCLLSTLHACYDRMNLKYELWPVAWNNMN